MWQLTVQVPIRFAGNGAFARSFWLMPVPLGTPRWYGDCEAFADSPRNREELMGMCLNKRVLIGLGVVALGVLAVSPRTFGAVAPLLMMAACPLSMIFMMRTMNRDGASCGADQMVKTGEATSAERDVPDAYGEPGPSTAGADRRVRELEAELASLKANPHKQQSLN